MNSHKTMDDTQSKKKEREIHLHVQLLAYQHELTLYCMKSLNISVYTKY